MDQPEKVNIVVVRTYDCSFCKRGFSNAQALGGHMNVHRRDKAEAKKVISHGECSSLSHKAMNEMDYNMIISNNCRYFSRVPCYHHRRNHHHQSQHDYAALAARRVNYRMHFPTQKMHPVIRGSCTLENLSWRIGPRLVGDGESNEGVDLELRLGRNP
ncbi:hypothetical protein Vadar_022524 [Vaccinium darrowii]|uniref:Uncharacterized protein n=1 Tax=Vaccinium darrowii TaxID=229202 RepID=A0ACB7XTI7_9ERIC|nr:hypothetical protein Vadar_022524 [Vaccinium darrowii]